MQARTHKHITHIWNRATVCVFCSVPYSATIVDKQEEDHHKCRDQTHTHTWLWLHSQGSLASSELIKMCKTTPLVFSFLICPPSLSLVLYFLPFKILLSHFSVVVLLDFYLLDCFLYAKFSINLLISSLDHSVHILENTVALLHLMYWFCVCVWGRVAVLYEWLLGRTGGVREEFVNYEWSSSLWMWIINSESVCVSVFVWVCVCC